MLKKLTLSLCLFLVSCGSGQIKDLVDNVVKTPDRKPIDTTRMGVNAFFNNSVFGSISAQASEVKNTLGLNTVRVLFNWGDSIQPTPSSDQDFSFYDDIVDAVEAAGLTAMPVITGLPSWMANPANWQDGNPRTTFVEMWVKSVVERYSSRSGIVGYQIWNEPNMTSNDENITLDVALNPVNYLEMLCRAYSRVKDASPGKLVLNAATTAIAQNYPDTLNYNKTFHSNGAENCIDIYAIHVYGKQFENYVVNGGIEDFFKGVNKTVWVTESGAQGINEQLPYVEQVWPFIREKIPQIDLIFYYQFAEATPSDITYGLRNPTPGFQLSDLYISLRDR